MTNLEVICISSIVGSVSGILATIVQMLRQQPGIHAQRKRVAEGEYLGVPGAAAAQRHAQANIAGDAVAAAIARDYDRAVERDYLGPLRDQQRPADEETLRKPGFKVRRIRIVSEAMQAASTAARVRERRCTFCGISMGPNEQDGYACSDDTACFQRCEEQANARGLLAYRKRRTP